MNSPHPDQSQQKLEHELHAAIKKVEHDIPALKFNTAIAVLMELANDWQSARLELEKKKAGETRHETEQRARANNERPQSLFSHQDLGKIIRLLAPFAPFMAEELWLQWPGEFSVHQQPWPEYQTELAQAELVTIPVQVNGKVRGELKIPSDEIEQLDSAAVIAQAKQLASVQKWLTDEEGEPPELKKELYVPGRIVSLVK